MRVCTPQGSLAITSGPAHQTMLKIEYFDVSEDVSINGRKFQLTTKVEEVQITQLWVSRLSG